MRLCDFGSENVDIICVIFLLQGTNSELLWESHKMESKVGSMETIDGPVY
jgi:hypothetical protein